MKSIEKKLKYIKDYFEFKIDSQKVKDWDKFKDKPIIVEFGKIAKLFITCPKPLFLYRESTYLRSQGDFYIRIFGDGQLYIYCNYNSRKPEFIKYCKIENAPFSIKIIIPKEKKEVVII